MDAFAILVKASNALPKKDEARPDVGICFHERVNLEN